jgi:hydrogenase maturation protein HypF
MRDPSDRRHEYPYINCTDCGPRYSIVGALPYDRSRTSMAGWRMCAACAAEYHAASDRRFHAQPIACPACGPHYYLKDADRIMEGDASAIHEAVELLRGGGIVAIKGLGGYHLACDAENVRAVRALRERKFRKEKPFAVMVRDLDVARDTVTLSPESEQLLTSDARPIVLAPARLALDEVAPDNDDLGVMLPYAPLHHLLFACGAPERLVMTSGNRSSEPIAYRDADAFARLGGIADAFLAGERPIIRRLDDSVARAGNAGPAILRRSRGYAPGAVAQLPTDRPILAVGADLKNTVTLVVRGQAYVSQHVGDLEHYDALEAFRETIRDLIGMYEVGWDDLLVVHDLHPEYASTTHALTLPVKETRPVQHHRAHIASVLAERRAFETRVLGVSFDGTGYGDDGTIWGGEFFAGSLCGGFDRVAHLRPAVLPGGDAAARYPVQAAAGFVAELPGLPDLTADPFRFPDRYLRARALVRKDVRSFPTTSAGRLFDAIAALVGFTRETTFEGQAAVWLQQLAQRTSTDETWPMTFAADELDWRPMLEAVVGARLAGVDRRVIARAFHRGLAQGIGHAIHALLDRYRLDTVVLSGGVFQNELLVSEIGRVLASSSIPIWVNRDVPSNDGGISLGQAALALEAGTSPRAARASLPAVRGAIHGETRR